MIFLRGVNTWPPDRVILSGVKQVLQEHRQIRYNCQAAPNVGERHHIKNIILPAHLDFGVPLPCAQIFFTYDDIGGTFTYDSDFRMQRNRKDFQ